MTGPPTVSVRDLSTTACEDPALISSDTEPVRLSLTPGPAVRVCAMMLSGAFDLDARSLEGACHAGIVSSDAPCDVIGAGSLPIGVSTENRHVGPLGRRTWGCRRSRAPAACSPT